MKKAFFALSLALAFALALVLVAYGRTVTPPVAEPFDTTGIPSDAHGVCYTDSKKGAVMPSDFMTESINGKECRVLDIVSQRLGFDAAKDVATGTLVESPRSIGVILRGNLPAEKIVAAAKKGSDAQAVVRVGERFLIKTFLLNGMEKIAENVPMLIVPIDDKTLLVVWSKEEKDVQPFLAVFDGKAAKFALPPELDALCKQLAPVHGVFYLKEDKDIDLEWIAGCKGILAVQSNDSKNMRWRVRLSYGKTIADPAKTERSVKEFLGVLPALSNNNFKNPDGTINDEKAAQFKRWTEMNSAIKWKVSGKTVSADLDYPSADFLKIIEVFRRPSAEKP